VNRLQICTGYLDTKLQKAVADAEVLPVEQSRQGSPLVLIDGVRLHSAFDPVRDAGRVVSRWLTNSGVNDGDTVIMHGMGLGYYLEALAESLPHSPLRVLVPDAALLRTALEHRDLTLLLQQERITFHLEPEADAAGAEVYHLRLPVIKQVYADTCRLWDRQLAGSDNNRSLRIQVVTPIHGGSLPVALAAADALRELGHQVNLVDCSQFAATYRYLEERLQEGRHESHLLGRLVELLSDYVLVEAESFQPQMVLALAQAPLTSAALRELKRNRILTAYWFVEDYQRITYWQSIAPHYDLFFTIQRGEFHRQLRELGVRHPLYLPLAADTRTYYPLSPGEVDDACRSELSFVGAGYHNREIFFLGLYGQDFKIWGAEWNPRHPLQRHVQNDAARTDTEQNRQIFNGSHFNLNLHSSSHLAGVDPEGDFVNPRVFDIAACRGFQLVDRRELLPELFEEDREIVVYEDIEDLRAKLEHYRRHPEQRRAIAAAAYERVQGEHTYSRRMEQLLQAAVELFPEQLRGGDSRNSAATLRAALPDDAEWQQLLAEYTDAEELTLSRLEADIRDQGELTTAGMVVLFAAELERWARRKQLLIPARTATST